MPKGVEINGKKLRVYFNYEGERIREPLNLENTPENVDYAADMVKQIEREQKLGRFDLARWFPESRHLLHKSLGFWLDTWLDIRKERTADTTYRCYAQKANSHIRPIFAKRQVEDIDQVEIETWITKDLAKLSSKSIKDCVAILRSVLALYRTRYPNTIDPTAAIKIKLPDDEDPDPFTRDEISRIINTHPRLDRWPELNMVKFMLWSGPRISEALPLAWEDVDLKAGEVRFRRAKVASVIKSTKTKRSTRTHELIKPALEALQDQYKLTGHLKQQFVEVKQRDNRTIKTERLSFVFLNSRTGTTHVNFHLRDRFFKAHLERADVRYRGPGQCRHTYISQMLTIGMPVEWISYQTGTSVEMIRRRYGKWMPTDAKDIIRLANKRLGF